MQTVNNNKPEQINSALFAISDDITKQNIQTRNEIKSSEAAMQKQIDKLTDSLKNNGGLITGGTYNINISGNASTATNATNATNADKATQDSAGNTITATYATKTEVPTKTSQLTNDSSFVTSGQLATVATTGSYNDLSNKPTIPTNTNQLTNGAGYITSSSDITGNAATATTAAKLGRNGDTGVPMTFNWSGQGGQPVWLWGGNDGSNMYVYNPYNFNVNSATTAAKVVSAGDSAGWIEGRKYAICKTTVAGVNNGWTALTSIKTASGSIEIGNLSGEDSIRIVYSSDANVNAGNNYVTQIVFIKNNAVIVFPKIDATPGGIRIPTSKPSSVSPGDIWIE